MRQLRVWLDEPSVGSGFHVVLEASQGHRYAHLLHVPSLSRIKMPLDELARQERRGIATETKPSRGLIGRIEARMRDFNRRKAQYPEQFVKEVLAAIREEKAEAA